MKYASIGPEDKNLIFDPTGDQQTDSELNIDE